MPGAWRNSPSIMLALYAIGAQMAEAQTAATSAQQIEPAWMACSESNQPSMREAIERASSLLARSWLSHERGSFAAYTMPGERRNPFDLTPKETDGGPRDGIVQTRPPRCSMRAAEVPNAVVVRFTTPFYRFYEDGHGWSPPLRDGVMLEALVVAVGGTWQARDISGEKSILLPEQKPRVAAVSQLPAETEWVEPMPGCPRRTKWNGEACVARKR